MRDAVDRRHSLPTLVVGVDFRAGSLHALRHSMRMLERGLAREVHVLHVLEGEQAHDAALRACVPAALAELALEVGDASRVAGHPTRAWAHVRSGGAALELRRLAFDVGADLIVIGERREEVAPMRDEVARDPLAPFSVLVAGRALVLESRAFECARCELCERLRSAPEANVVWCPAHARPGVAALPIEARPELRESMRVLH